MFFGPNFERNLAIELVEAGLGLAASCDIEPTYRNKYFQAAERAYLDNVGMWAPGACGGDPDTWPDFDAIVNYDASGIEVDNINGEWIEIRNHGPGQLDMTRWTLRGSGRNNGRTSYIPDGTTVPAGGKLRIHVGSGTNSATHVYLGRTRPYLSNDSEIVYLRDKNFNIRYFEVYPCTITCEKTGTLVIEAASYNPPGEDDLNPNGEWIRVRNVGDGTLDLTDWKIWDNSADYRFKEGQTLGEGKSLTIRVGKGKDTAETLYWGRKSSVLANGGAELWVFTNRHVRVDCYSYGSFECSAEPIRGAIRLTAHYDARGNDRTRPNGEWIALENTSTDRVKLAGYVVQVGTRKYTFPSGTRIEPGKRLRLRVGSGSNTSANQYWGYSSGILRNSGGSVQLREPGGDVILEHRWRCSDCGPDGPFVIDRVKYNARGVDRTNPNGEWIRLRNVGSERASLRDYMVKAGKRQYVFLKNVWLDPGETVRLRIGKGSDTSRNVFWGYNRDILRNRGKRVTLSTPYREVVDCVAWGDVTCS